MEKTREEKPEKRVVELRNDVPEKRSVLQGEGKEWNCKERAKNGDAMHWQGQGMGEQRIEEIRI